MIMATKRFCLSAVMAVGLTGPWLYAPAIAQDLHYIGPVSFLMRRPVTELLLNQDINYGEFAGRHSSGEGNNRGHNVAINISTSGFLYHPALVTYNANITQSNHDYSFTSSTSDNENTNKGGFFGYELDTLWLKNKSYTLEWSMSHDQTRVANSLMRPEALNESTRKNGTLDLQFALMPTQFNFGSSTVDIQSYYPEQRTDDYWYLTSRKLNDGNELNFDIRQNKTSRQVLDRNTMLDQKSAMVRHSRRLRNNGRFNLNGTTRSHIIEGDERVSTFGSSGLKLEHPANFRSNWNAAISSFHMGQRQTTSRMMGGSISHQLYENLTTTLGANRSYMQEEDGDLLREQRSIGLTYQRRIPWGRIQFSRGRSRDTIADQRTGKITEILDESYTFEGISTTIVLLNASVNVESIRITSADRLTVYEPGIDYSAELIGSTVLINRDSLAGINDDETVLVSYQFVNDLPTQRRNDVDTFSANIAIGRLSLGFSSTQQRVIQLEGFATSELPWSDTKSLTANYVTKNSSTILRIDKIRREFSDYEARSLTESLRFRPGPRTNLSINIQAMDIIFHQAGIQRREIGISSAVTSRVGRSGNFGVNGFVKQASGDQADRYNWGLNARYSWLYGAWRPAIIASYNNVDDRFAEYWARGYSVRLELRRTFR